VTKIAVFSKFDLKKHLYGAEVAAFHIRGGIFFFYTVLDHTELSAIKYLKKL